MKASATGFLLGLIPGLIFLGVWSLNDSQHRQMERELEEWQRQEWLDQLREQRRQEFAEQIGVKV